jgi:NAD(P)-dependent dehydrogenase (short-subunit alcohol dehydrogenase family)
MRLEGRTAVVTGGAQGIGLATAEALAAAGARVVVADLERPPAEEVRFVRTDVTDPAALQRLFADAEDLAVLVNNAGGRAEPFYPDAPPERWSAVLELNLHAPMLATQLAIATMRRQHNGGAIVNVGSSAGVGYAPHISPEYAAAKAGLMRLAGALAGLADEGIRVSCVAPGLVDTPAARSSGAPIERARSAADIANLIVALAIDDTSAGRVVFWPEDGEAQILSSSARAPAARSGGS